MTNSVEHKGTAARIVTCPRCGHDFTCSLSLTCWCVTREVSPELKRYLAEHYTTCVCSVCLDQLTENRVGGESL
ncbi:MAG: cysteine-rich CWC family protein [Chlorobium sp.]